MHTVDPLPRQTLRPHERIDSLRCGPALRRAAPTAASPAEYHHRSAARSSTESSATGTSWAPEPARRSLSGDRVAHVSKCTLRVRASGTAITGLWETAQLVRGLTHRDGPDHLHCIGGGHLPELPRDCAGILLVVRIGLVDLILTIAAPIQANLLEGAPPAPLALASLAGPALLSVAAANPSDRLRRCVIGCGRT
jgi:hypothetical protein